MLISNLEKPQQAIISK